MTRSHREATPADFPEETVIVRAGRGSPPSRLLSPEDTTTALQSMGRAPLILCALLAPLAACESPTMFGRDEIDLSFVEELRAEGPGTAGAWRSPDGTAAGHAPVRGGHSRAPRPVEPVAPRVMIFDVSDLVTPVPSFAAPEMDLAPSGGGFDWPQAPEPAAAMDEDLLLDLLRAAIPEDLLHEDSTMRISGGRLIVTNPAR